MGDGHGHEQDEYTADDQWRWSCGQNIRVELVGKGIACGEQEEHRVGI
jgi:hypothetical protein